MYRCNSKILNKDQQSDSIPFPIQPSMYNNRSRCQLHSTHPLPCLPLQPFQTYQQSRNAYECECLKHNQTLYMQYSGVNISENTFRHRRKQRGPQGREQGVRFLGGGGSKAAYHQLGLGSTVSSPSGELVFLHSSHPRVSLVAISSYIG